jgi:D-glycero-alpha-D-manno-heptose-7-phosphate kinase
MLIVQAPLRVSLFGGGTDFAGYFKEEGGCVLTSAIDKYIFVTIKHRFDAMLRVGWTRTEMVPTLDEIHHELIREALRMAKIHQGIEITTMGDIPSEGSGLGSSSTVTVGALHAAHSLQGELVNAEQLARESCTIEIDVLGKPIGIQDQYIAAYGGLRFMRFEEDGTVTHKRIHLERRLQSTLDENLLLFYTGVSRKSSDILTEQKENIKDRRAVLGEMKQLAVEATVCLEAGKLDELGPLLHESWQLKRQLASKVSNSGLDEMYEVAREAGATGGKITGAGGGGFLLLYCPAGRQTAVRDALSRFPGVSELIFKTNAGGSQVIFNYRR